MSEKYPGMKIPLMEIVEGDKRVWFDVSYYDKTWTELNSMRQVCCSWESVVMLLDEWHRLVQLEAANEDGLLAHERRLYDSIIVEVNRDFN